MDYLLSLTKNILYAAVTAGAGLLAALFVFQTRLVYPSNLPQGSTAKVDTPDTLGLQFDAAAIATKDGLLLQAFLVKPSRASKVTVVYFQSNAGNIGHRLPLAQVFSRDLGCYVLMVSYRGYGLSPGSPNEAGLKIDALATLSYVASHPILGKTKVVIYGQSIGGAVSIYAAASAHKSDLKVSALILENTFTSLPKLIPSVLPFLTRLVFLCTEIWDSEKEIRKVNVPILFLSGEKDALVPPSHMDRLHAICTEKEANPRLKLSEMVKFKNGTHNDTCMQPGYFNYIEKFIKKL